MNAAVEADDSKVDFENSIKEGFSGLLNLIQRIIEYGQKQKEIDNDLDDRQLAIYILCFFGRIFSNKPIVSR